MASARKTAAKKTSSRSKASGSTRSTGTNSRRGAKDPGQSRSTLPGHAPEGAPVGSKAAVPKNPVRNVTE